MRPYEKREVFGALCVRGMGVGELSVQGVGVGVFECRTCALA